MKIKTRKEKQKELNSKVKKRKKKEYSLYNYILKHIL